MSQRESALAPAGISPQSLPKLAELESALGSVLRGKPEAVRLSLVCLLLRRLEVQLLRADLFMVVQ